MMKDAMMKRLKTIVVEDERLPRLTLLQKLEELRQQVEVVDSCDNYDDALQSILHHQPDLVLMDIQLQGRDAMQLLVELQQTIPLPQVIFTTAYADRRYLMSAIKLSAVDYLMKPVSKNELALAIAKAVQNSSHNTDGEVNTGRLSLKTVTGKVYLQTDDIAYIRADGNYSRLTTFDSEEVIMDSLAALERKLDPAVFVRIDRSTIVNAQRVYKVNAKRRVCSLRSAGGKTIELPLSKTGIEALMKMI